VAGPYVRSLFFPEGMGLQSFFLVGIAGAAGAVSRYGVGLLAERSFGGHFAFGTLLVNVLGCLALGFLLELDRGTTLVTHPVRMLLAVGFLGAFTTFSTFGYETLRYLQEGTSPPCPAQRLGQSGAGAGGRVVGIHIRPPGLACRLISSFSW